LSYAPKTSTFKNKINSLKRDIKNNDLDLIKNLKTHKKQKFGQKIIFSDKHMIAILASEFMISRLKGNVKQ